MKILAALKKIKHLDRKIEKNMKRIGKWCSYVEDGNGDPEPTYDGNDILTMHQQIVDWTVQKATIRHALHLTNMRTTVVEGKYKDMTIDELLLIQNVVIPQKIAAQKIMRREEKGGGYMSRHDISKDAYVVLQYEPKDRDKAVEKLENEKDLLDELLDNLNIDTEVIGI